MKIIVKYNQGLDKAALSRFGNVLNDLDRMEMLFLSVEDSAVIEEIRHTAGVVYAEPDTRREAPKLLQSIWTGTMGDFNRFIYQEMNVETAWAITKGDPRIKIAVLDSGCDTRHPNLTVVSGGVIQEGTLLTQQRFPMKIVVNEFAGDYPIESKGAIGVYECVDSMHDGSVRVPVSCYADSTCRQVLFTGEAPPNIAASLSYFWVDRPIDMHFVFDDTPDSTIDKWCLGLGLDAMRDLYAHGTACCGVINGQHDGSGVYGIAPDCTTVAYKVYSDEAWFNTTDLIMGVYTATNDGCHIISYSISANEIFPGEADAWQYALDNGVIFVAAAGNSGKFPQANTSDIYLYPASYTGVIGVGGVGDRLSQTDAGGFIDSDPSIMDYSRMCYFTQKNDKVFICAPSDGWRLHSPMNYARMWQVGNRTEQYIREYGCQSESGTSFGTPATAGGIALMQSKKIAGLVTQDPFEIRQWLTANCPRATIMSTMASTAKLPVKLSNGNTATGGYGNGRFDIGAAVTAI